MAEELELDHEKTNRRCFLGQRHVVTLVGIFNAFFLAANRLVLGVSIVAMVKQEQTNETSEWNASEISCPAPSATSKPVAESNFQGEFDWSTQLQGYLLGIGFLSYITTQTVAGKFADSLGSKPLLVYSNALSGVLVIISPLAARWHVYALMAVQFLRGASQGITTPALYKMMSNWIPRNERGTLSTLMMSGYSVGIAVVGTVTGWLCDVPGLGWPSAFYIWGSICVFYTTVTHFVYYEHPENNPWITDEELKYITNGLEAKVSKEQPPTPWKKMFSSIPTYALFYALFGFYWGINYFTTVHPTFMGTVLHYSMTENGLTSCFPALITAASSVLTSMVSHWVSRKDLISLNALRKTATSLSAFGFSLGMVGILLAGCDKVVNLLCFVLALFFLGIGNSGVAISGVDMAPVFAGSLMGVASSVAGLGNVLVPVVTGLLTTHKTLSEWQIVFWINFGVLGSSGLVYILFGSAEAQPWNYPEGELSTEATNEERRNADKNLNQAKEIKEKIEMHGT